MDVVRVSKRLSYVLRHRPGSIGVALDDAGWTDVAALLAALTAHGLPLTREELDRVVATNDKRRFAFDASGRRIRASQGHSRRVDLGYVPEPPPSELFHGTVERFSRPSWPRAFGPDAGTRCTSARTPSRPARWVDVAGVPSSFGSMPGAWRPMVIPSRARRTASGWSTPFRRDTWR